MCWSADNVVWKITRIIAMSGQREPQVHVHYPQRRMGRDATLPLQLKFYPNVYHLFAGLKHDLMGRRTKDNSSPQLFKSGYTPKQVA